MNFRVFLDVLKSQFNKHLFFLILDEYYNETQDCLNLMNTVSSVVIIHCGFFYALWLVLCTTKLDDSTTWIQSKSDPWWVWSQKQWTVITTSLKMLIDTWSFALTPHCSPPALGSRFPPHHNKVIHTISHSSLAQRVAPPGFHLALASASILTCKDSFNASETCCKIHLQILEKHNIPWGTLKV
jgi:hypothetical protein